MKNVLKGLGLALLMAGAALLPAAAQNAYYAAICRASGQCHTVPAVTSDTFTLNAATQALTNKTLDAEATGNVLTTVEKVWLPAAICQNVTAISGWSLPTAGAAAISCDTGTNTQKGTLDYTDDGATVIGAQTTVMLPGDFTGTVDARIRWFSAATTGNVVWQLATVCVADAETSDPAFSAASTVTDATKGTTLQDNDATITGVTITTCAASELMYLRLFRDPANASDTLGATASVRGLQLTFRRAQ